MDGYSNNNESKHYRIDQQFVHHAQSAHSTGIFHLAYSMEHIACIQKLTQQKFRLSKSTTKPSVEA